MSQEDDNASGSLDAAEKRFMMYDERWRVVATFRDQDAAPKETYVYHAAGWNGSGDAAYIDSVILRDRDNTACSGTGCDPRLAASDGTLEERRFYCQNWRADVVAIAAADGTPIEQTRYSAYGEPTVYPLADVNMDGKVDAADLGAWTDLLSGGAADLAYPGGDIDFDGWFDPGSSPDDGEFYDSYNANLGKSGKGRQSSPSVDNRIGYAGYQWDQAVRANHVRYRVYLPEIGRWTRRDPLGYVDGACLYAYAMSSPVASRDAFGLDIIFDPSMTPAQQEKIRESAERVRKKLKDTILGILRVVDRLTPCEGKYLKSTVSNMIAHLTSISNHLRPFNPRPGEMTMNPDAIDWHISEGPVADAEDGPRDGATQASKCGDYYTTLNTKSNYNWNDKNDEDLDQLLLHEAAHTRGYP